MNRGFGYGKGTISEGGGGRVVVGMPYSCQWYCFQVVGPCTVGELLTNFSRIRSRIKI